MIREPYENLANAIVLRAVRDYRKAVKTLQEKPRNKKAKEEIRSIEKFIKSEWFDVLTKINPEKLLESLHMEVKDERKRKRIFTKSI